MPLVRVQAQQRAVVLALHGTGDRLEGGLNPAGSCVKLPGHTGVLHKGVGMAGEQGQGLGFVVWQRRG